MFLDCARLPAPNLNLEAMVDLGRLGSSLIHILVFWDLVLQEYSNILCESRPWPGDLLLWLSVSLFFLPGSITLVTTNGDKHDYDFFGGEKGKNWNGRCICDWYIDLWTLQIYFNSWQSYLERKWYCAAQDGCHHHGECTAFMLMNSLTFLPETLQVVTVTLKTTKSDCYREVTRWYYARLNVPMSLRFSLKGTVWACIRSLGPFPKWRPPIVHTYMHIYIYTCSETIMQLQWVDNTLCVCAFQELEVKTWQVCLTEGLVCNTVSRYEIISSWAVVWRSNWLPCANS